MIKLLSKLVKWLEVRFPEKVILLESDYSALKQKTEALEAKLKEVENGLETQVQSHAASIDRISMIESSAVHKGAVQDLVKIVSDIKADLASFKTSIGFRTQVQNDELQAVFNGEHISHE